MDNHYGRGYAGRGVYVFSDDCPLHGRNHQPTRSAKDYLLPEEVAEHLRCNIMTVYRHIKSGNLKAMKIGRTYRIQPYDLEAFLHRA